MVENNDRQDGGQTQDASQNQEAKEGEGRQDASAASQDKQDADSKPAEASDANDERQSQTQEEASEKTSDDPDPDQAQDQDAPSPENVQSSDLAEDESESVEAEEEDQPEPEQEQPQHYAREQLRAEIETKAGDSQSILGTTADATQLLLLLVSRVLRALNGSSDPAFSSIKSELAPFAAIAEGFLDKVENGTVKMPALVKGLEAVVAEVEERSTRVASVIEQHQKQQSPTSDDGGA